MSITIEQRRTEFLKFKSNCDTVLHFKNHNYKSNFFRGLISHFHIFSEWKKFHSITQQILNYSRFITSKLKFRNEILYKWKSQNFHSSIFFSKSFHPFLHLHFIFINILSQFYIYEVIYKYKFINELP